MPKPILMAVHEQLSERDALQRELTSRYSSGYDLVCEASPISALERLDELRAATGANVLILFAASQMATMSGTEFLERAHELHPHAQRVLLIPWGNRSASKPVLRMLSQGRFDRYATVPSRSPDENFHYVVTELLRDWQHQHPDRQTVVTVIDQRWSPRSYEIRDQLQRGGLPFAFHEADSPEGQALLGRVGRADGPFPVLIRYDGQILADPTNEELAQALGVRHASTEGVFDVVVVGAGPAGTVRRRVRGLRGTAHPRGRSGVDRRPGRHQLPHPQLPRLPGRCQWRGPVQPGSRSGVVVRRRNNCAARGSGSTGRA